MSQSCGGTISGSGADELYNNQQRRCCKNPGEPAELGNSDRKHEPDQKKNEKTAEGHEATITQVFNRNLRSKPAFLTWISEVVLG